MGRKSRAKTVRKLQPPDVPQATELATTKVVSVEDALKRARASQRRIEWERRRIAQAVGEARDGGASWADVAASLGVSRQAARQRFSDGNRSEAEGGSHDIDSAV